MDEGAATRQGFLARRFEAILGSQVDSVFYCTGATTMFTHRTRVGETYGEFCKDGGDPAAALARDNLRALAAAGHDPLELAVDFCHRNGLEMIELGHRHGLPVYPTISASGMRGPGGRYSSIEAWRGAASNLWRSGAEGVVIFNLFPHAPDPRFSELGSPETLTGLDKVFAVDPVQTLEGDLVQAIVQEQVLPISVPGAGGIASVALPIGDDIPAAARQAKLKSMKLLVEASPPRSIGLLEVRFNGRILVPRDRDPQNGRLWFTPSPDLCRAGPNEAAFRLAIPSSGPADALQITAVEAQVQYR